MLTRRRSSGLTLIELLITLAIAASLLMLAMPDFLRMLRNGQLRATAEGYQTGLQMARAEAIKRNTTMRFQLTSDATNACTLSADGRSWVISRDDPSGACAAAPSATTAPRIFQVRDMEQGEYAQVSAFRTGTPGNTQSLFVFNGLGQMITPTAAVTLRFRAEEEGSCKDEGGNMRCLHITVSPSGQVRMCDPTRSGTDPEAC